MTVMASVYATFLGMDVVALAALMTSNINAHTGGCSKLGCHCGQLGNALLAATVDAANAEIVAIPAVRLLTSRMKRLGRSAMKFG